MGEGDRYILTLGCPDRRGIVAAVAGYLAGADCNILESAQYDDLSVGQFFMRVVFASEGGGDAAALRDGFARVADGYGMTWRIDDAAEKVRTILMVSKLGHCLNDLLYRGAIGALPLEIVAVVSNHRDLEPAAAQHGVRFVHIPVDPADKTGAEAALLALYEAERCELIVLARYMQVLSDRLSARLTGRIINIHHSFLPSFKGARPYTQAHARGVKLIGATAHYVTADLDEGPIIEQEVARVGHAATPEDMVAIGRDTESLVLARAVTWHAERRVLPNGARTIVFR